ncbi:MAG: cytochrome P450 [Pseudonocardiaceae bacterium]
MARMLDTSLRLDISGPKGVPILNNLWFRLNPTSYVLDRLAPFSMQSVLPITDRNGSLAIVHGAEASKQFFTDNATFFRANDGALELPSGYPWSRMFDAVITANGQEHRRRRRLLAPIFHSSVMDHYQAVFADTFYKSKFANHNDQVFDMVEEFRTLARTNMLVCLMGVDSDASNLELAARVTELVDMMLRPTVAMFRRNHWCTPYGRWIRRVADAYERLRLLIERRRTEEPRRDALSILCHTKDEEGDFLTTQEIAGELNGLFAAGYETTASAMCWAMLTCLSQPDLTAEGLDATIYETQRLIPSVPISLPRRVMREVSVGSSPPVPRGAVMMVSPLLEHRNPDVFPNPHNFDPGRWRDFKPSPYVFLPFGIGQRRCPGAGFADLQVRTTLRLILEHNWWHVLNTHVNYHIGSAVISMPDSPIPVKRGAKTAIPPLTGSLTKLWRRT